MMNVKIVSIYTFMSRINRWLLLFKPENPIGSDYFDIYENFNT